MFLLFEITDLPGLSYFKTGLTGSMKLCQFVWTIEGPYRDNVFGQFEFKSSQSSQVFRNCPTGSMEHLLFFITITNEDHNRAIQGPLQDHVLGSWIPVVKFSKLDLLGLWDMPK